MKLVIGLLGIVAGLLLSLVPSLFYQEKTIEEEATAVVQPVVTEVNNSFKFMGTFDDNKCRVWLHKPNINISVYFSRCGDSPVSISGFHH